MLSKSMPTRSANSGATLLEVLIAMVVLAIGLLGLAGLQASSLKNNQNAYFRSQATVLAYDIIDRLRTYPSDARTLSGITFATTGTGNAAGLALADITEWKSALNRELPLGKGSITVVDATAGTVLITIRWLEGRGTDESGTDPCPPAQSSNPSKVVFCTMTEI